jgi:hypothetical protein
MRKPLRVSGAVYSLVSFSISANISSNVS